MKLSETFKLFIGPPRSSGTCRYGHVDYQQKFNPYPPVSFPQNEPTLWRLSFPNAFENSFNEKLTIIATSNAQLLKSSNPFPPSLYPLKSIRNQNLSYSFEIIIYSWIHKRLRKSLSWYDKTRPNICFYSSIIIPSLQVLR